MPCRGCLGEPGIADGFTELQLRMAKAFARQTLTAGYLAEIGAGFDYWENGVTGWAFRALLAMPSWMTHRQTSLKIVVHRDPKTGEYRFPGRSDAPCPKGFQPIEITSIQQARKIENDIRKQDSQRAAEAAYNNLARVDHNLAANAHDLREALRTDEYQVPDPKDPTKTIRVKGITAQGKELIAAGLDHIKEAREKPMKTIQPEVGFEALNYDQSNREPYRDAATNWKQVKD